MKKFSIFILIFMLFASACQGVKRVKTDKVIDLSGKWNDTDSRLVSEEMIEDALKRPWINKFKTKNKNKLPVLIVGKVKNRSHEHINVQTFTKDLERALINSGEVEFVADSGQREELREERRDQAIRSSEGTAKSEGEEVGADFMLKGSINTIIDKIEGKAVMFYHVNLEIIEILTNKKVWIGEKKIKKYIKQNKFSL